MFHMNLIFVQKPQRIFSSVLFKHKGLEFLPEPERITCPQVHLQLVPDRNSSRLSVCLWRRREELQDLDWLSRRHRSAVCSVTERGSLWISRGKAEPRPRLRPAAGRRLICGSEEGSNNFPPKSPDFGIQGRTRGASGATEQRADVCGIGRCWFCAGHTSHFTAFIWRNLFTKTHCGSAIESD